MIEFKNITYSYGENTKGALNNLSFLINRGEFILLTGKSGSGKSTILQMINGIIPQYYKGNMSGEVLIDNQNMANKSVQERSLLVGTVFQNPKSQFFHLDTYDELTFGPTNHMVEKEEIEKRATVAINKFNLKSIKNTNVLTLSGGEMQRLSCASVYMSLPQIYVLDEPSANLDTQGIEELKKALLTIKESGATILIAEHRIYYALDLCDRVMHIDEGKIKCEYSKDEFMQLSKDSITKMGLRSSRAPLISTTRFDIDAADCVEIEKICCKFNKCEILDIKNLCIPKNK